MKTAATAKRRVAGAVQEDRVMQPLEDLSGLARSILRRVYADFPTVFSPRRDRRAEDRAGGGA